MKNYIVFNNEGRILRTGICSDKAFLLQAREGENLMEGSASNLTKRISMSDKTIVNKSEMPIKVNKMEVVEDEEIIITKIPLGAQVEVEGEGAHIIDDGLLVLTFDTAGKYTIKFRHFPYLMWEGEITCV